MRRSTIETVLGALVLLIAAIFLIFSYQTADMSQGPDGYELHATFTNIGSLRVGDPVNMAGVKIGTVNGIKLTEFFEAQVTLSIKKGLEVPEDSAALISSTSLLGGQFLEIQPGGSLDNIEPGGKITHTQPHISLSELLGKFIYSASGSSDNSSSSGDTPHPPGGAYGGSDFAP